MKCKRTHNHVNAVFRLALWKVPIFFVLFIAYYKLSGTLGMSESFCIVKRTVTVKIILLSEFEL